MHHANVGLIAAHFYVYNSDTNDCQGGNGEVGHYYGGYIIEKGNLKL